MGGFRKGHWGFLLNFNIAPLYSIPSGYSLIYFTRHMPQNRSTHHVIHPALALDLKYLRDMERDFLIIYFVLNCNAGFVMPYHWNAIEV